MKIPYVCPDMTDEEIKFQSDPLKTPKAQATVKLVLETIKLGDLETAGNIFARLSKERFMVACQGACIAGRLKRVIDAEEAMVTPSTIVRTHTRLVRCLAIDYSIDVIETELNGFCMGFTGSTIHKGPVTLIGALETAVKVFDNVGGVHSCLFSWKQRFVV
jgi:hypothetical protein